MSSTPPEAGLKARLYHALADAKQRRDLTSVAGLRAAFVALDEAETIQLPGEAGSILAMGLAPSHIPLGEHGVRRLLMRLRDEREQAASQADPVRARRLRGEAAALSDVLTEA